MEYGLDGIQTEMRAQTHGGRRAGGTPKCVRFVSDFVTLRRSEKRSKSDAILPVQTQSCVKAMPTSLAPVFDGIPLLIATSRTSVQLDPRGAQAEI
jgi:hypothetical protein